tara:strand:+ start:5125 stop:10062 length:4938 start_codon:yes stop_codon:yes gene_type:complete
MACNLIRNEQGDITNVFLNNGKPSELFASIDAIVENKEASYSAYLEILNKSEAGQLNLLDNFSPMNKQGEPNIILNPRAMQIITTAASNPGMFADKTRQLEHEFRKDILQESLENFLAGINVQIETVDNIHDKNNNKLDVIGKAQMLQRIIEVSSGASDVNTLAEESAHFAVELLRADLNPLYTSMLRLIENYAEYQEMRNPNNFYYKQYKGNIDMLKREAIGKIIAKHIMNKGTDLNTQELNKEKLSRLQRWWEKVLNFLKKLMGRNVNPFVKSSEIILDSKLQDVLRTDPNQIILPDTEFFQDSNDKKLTPLERIEKDQSIYKPQQVDIANNPLFKLLSEDGALQIRRYVNLQTGEILENSMSDKSALEFKKSKKDYFGYSPEQEAKFKMHSKLRTDTGNRIHGVMEELINYHTGQSEVTPAELENKYTEYGKFFRKINAYAKHLVNEINSIQAEINKKNPEQKGKAEIRTELMVINKKTNSGGTIDLVAFFSDGSAAIFDYKSKIANVAKAGARMGNNGKIILDKDLWLNSADMYALQIGQYNQTLVSQYGVTEVRRSRILPILISFQKNAQGIPMNIVQDLQLETDESPYMSQLPVTKEKTGMPKIDKLIEDETRRLKLLQAEQKTASYTDSQRLQRQIEASRKILKDLQLDQSIDAVLTEAFRLANNTIKALSVENEFLDDGSINPEYMTISDLNNAYRDLIHFRNFTTMDEVVAKLKGKRKEVIENALSEVKTKIDAALDGTNSIKEKMMERLIVLTNKEGVKGIDTFNRQIGKVTADWVSRSNQSHPALRFIHKTKSSVEANLVRIEKELAAEIEEKVRALESKFGKGVAIYDKLINPKTMNLWARFNEQFTEDRKKAYENKNIEWLKTYMEVNEDLIAKEYKNWKSNQVKLLRESGMPATEQGKKLAAWEKRFNPKYNSAWLNPTNPFIKVIKDNVKLSKYLAPEFMEIQQTPELKDFYEFHVKRTMEFLKLMGSNKSYNFITNLQKDMVDQMLEGDWTLGGMKQSFLDMFQVNEHDIQFGMEDMDGNFLRNVPRFGLAELTRTDENGRKIRDVSLKSKELGKSLYLLGKSAYMYHYLNELAPTMLMMETLYTMKDGILEAKEDKTSSLVTDVLGNVIPTLNQTNTNTITEYINAEFFGRSLTTTDAVSKSGISRNKTVLTLKNYNTMATLGLKVPVAMGALGAGFLGLEMQAAKGLYITRKNLRKAEAAYFTRDPKVRAIFEYFEITLEDMSKRRADLLSSDTRTKFMTGDRWYEFLARADRTLDAISASAMAMNYGVHPETGKLDLLKYLPEGTKALWDTIEYTEIENYLSEGTKDRYKSLIPKVENLENDNNNWISFRQKVHRVGSAVKGAVPKDDRFNSQTKLINRLFIHYRSWLPGLAFERFGNLRYDYVMENFNQGTWKSLWGNIGKEAAFNDFGQLVDIETQMHVFTMDALKDLLKIGVDVTTFGLTNTYKIKENRARLEFEAFLNEQKGNPEFDFTTEEEKEVLFEKFIDFKRGNIKGALMELKAVFALLMLMTALGGDWDEDGKIDANQTWVGRKMHGIFGRIYRETAVFYDLREMAGPRSSGIPLISLAQNGLKWVGNSYDEIGDTMFGEDSVRDKSGIGYYSWKFVPGLHGIVKAAEIYPQDKVVR